MKTFKRATEKRFLIGLLCFAMITFLALTCSAQNIVSGEITGTVSDPSGAVVPNATVALKSVDTGETQTTKTAAAGSFRFPLLRPGNYQVTATAPGFNPVTRTVVVALGQVTSAPIQMAVAGSTQTVEITAEAPLLHTEDANLTQTYDVKQVQLLPNAGGDLTNYALTTPGVVVSTGGGYGNFTSNGIGGMSNLYTINGNDYNDPYLNLNNSGASNMLLGANEVQEVSVVTNGYTAQYGRVAGSNLNYTTKSGSNQFHGNANWLWNGALLNANDWFNNNTDTPRPHAVSNQWAGSFGGPIKKNKIFFFYDNEGIRYVLPSGGPVFIPSANFEKAVLANLSANQPSSVPFYSKAFQVYNGASGFSRAVPVTNADDTSGALGCGDIGTTLYDPAVSGPCAMKFQDTVNNLNTERLQSIRIDVNLTQKDNLNFRYKQDRGVQATSTDPINNAFSANSVQPEDDGQFNWTHTLNDHMVNQFIASGLYYSAIFGPPNFAGATAVFPTSIAFGDGLFNGLGNFANFPQGRNVAQYQFIDDFSWTKGNHGIKFGGNFRRNDIGDFSGSPLRTGQITENSMTSFFNGVIDGGTFTQRFSKSLEFPVAYYSLGLYAQDEWAISPRLKLTFGLRMDRNSNMVCQRNCFARPTSDFLSMSHDPNTPYNQTIKNVTQAFPNLESAVWGPRVGFAWNPMGDGKTVVRGGFGLFSDLYPALLGSRVLTNLPNVVSFTITSGPISPDANNSVWAQAAANNAALQSAYNNGGTLASIKSVLPSFTAPNLTLFGSNIVNPKYLKWNFEIERAIGDKSSVSVNYVGNHGYDLFLTQQAYNAYCTTTKCPNGFENLPTSAPDTRFANVTQYQNGGRANYDGLSVSATRRLTAGFTGSFNYTWSHTLDDIYEGGIEPLNALANPSLRTVIDPFNVDKYNYASADQDIRHVISANYYWELPFKSTNGFLNNVIGGWMWSGVVLHNTGSPFSVYYTSITSSVLGNASNGRALGVMLTPGTGNCGGPTGAPCLLKSQFLATTSPALHQTTWGSNARNFFRGPGYFDSDMSLTKSFRLTEKGLTLSLGANAYNIFNHPNFDRPTGSLSSGLFGTIWETVSAPNSPYGNFQGAAVSGRILQSNLKVTF